MRALGHPVAWLKEHPFVADSLLAVAVFAFTITMMVTGPIAEHDSADFRSPDAIAAALLVVSAGLLAWRRRAPLAVFVAVAVVTFAYEGIGSYPPNSGLAVLVALYTVAAHCDRRRSLAALAGTALALPVLFATARWDPDLATVLSNYVFFGTVWLVGDNLQTRRAYVAQLTERAERAERERALEAERAVAEERARIARELHDVVAHAMSVVLLQVGGARRILARDPGRAAEALDVAETTGREAMSEMRALLGVLRDDGPVSRVPQPGLDRLRELVDHGRASGLDVELDLDLGDGDGGEALPPGIELAAYRIVQEALTNVRKHAGPAQVTATVTVRRDGDGLTIDVVDDGRGGAAPSDGAGQGQVGMRERVDLYGGELQVGPRPGGGYAVRARLPVAQEVGR